MPVKAIERLDEKRPFRQPWLDSCYQETLLPGTPWEKVQSTLCKSLAQKMERQLDIPQRRQMIFELVGQDFVKMYFSDKENDPSLLDPPGLSAEEKKRLQLDAQNWLQNTLNKVAAETGCQRLTSAQEMGVDLSAEMTSFLQHTRGVFHRGMDRHLYLQEQEIMKEVKDKVWQEHEAKLHEKEAQDKMQFWVPRLRGHHSGLRSILKNSGADPSRASMGTVISSVASRPVTANIKGSLHKMTEDPPTFWGMQSNSLGRSLIALLKRDPRRFGEVAAKLHGRQLPGTLRNYIWMDVLLRNDRKKLGDVNVEKVVRERFGKSVARGATELRIRRATHSPITGLIDNAVIELYDATPSMQMYIDDNVHMKEAARALNVMYVYDRSYEPYLIHWLFPLQLAFQDGSGNSEHVYDLSMYLDLLNKACMPKWPEVFAVGEQVMRVLSTDDPELHQHLTTVAQIHPSVNPKEFLVQLIHQEKAKADAILAATPESQKQQGMQLLADPRIFLRKWVGEGFVSVLDTQAVIFVWDQCFLQKWATSVLVDVCLALLLLLRHKFLETQDYTDMKRVFLREPCILYTMDIQRAWMHIQNKGNLEEVPPMNRQRPSAHQPVLPVPVAPRLPPKSPAVSEGSTRSPPVGPVGLKTIGLKLIIPMEHMQSVSWLKTLNPEKVCLQVHQYFGSIKIESKSSERSPVLKGVETDKYGSVTHKLAFESDRYIFGKIDASLYDVEQEMGGFPYAIVQVDYFDTQIQADPITLGWARIQLFKHREDFDSSPPKGLEPHEQWVIVEGDSSYTVYAGPLAGGILHAVPPTPPTKEQDYIGNNSELTAVVFDPRNEKTPEPIVRPSPKPSPKRTPKPSPRQSPKTGPAPSSLARPKKEKERSPKKTPSPVMDYKNAFDLYIDCVENIPDNASVIKVTGRLLKMGEVSVLPDLLAVPDHESSARSPRFKFRLTVNKEQREAKPGFLVLLRVYTADIDTQDLVVIGSCLFEFFDKKGKLKIGGHRRPAHMGMPATVKSNTEAINQGSLDDATIIPGCFFYFRVEHHSQIFKEAPDLATGYFVPKDLSLTKSEQCLLKSFQADTEFPKTVKDMVKELQKADGEQVEVTDWALWIRDRLDNKRYLQPNTPAGDLDLNRVVRYHIDVGMSVQINRAYGLPEGLYIQCFARIVPGNDTANKPATEEGYGKEEKMVSQLHDYSALQKAPVWKDESKVMHPHMDSLSYLLVQMFGIKAKYSPLKDHTAPGKITAANGKPLGLGEETVLGWAVVPLIDNQYVFTGEHHVPIFKGRPSAEILEALADDVPEHVLKEHKWTKNNKFESAVLVVTIHDSHFTLAELPAKPERLNFLLEAVGDTAKFEATEKDRRGKPMSQLIMDTLDKKTQKSGTTGPIYQKEQEFYEKLMGDQWINLMESALMDAGLGPL